MRYAASFERLLEYAAYDCGLRGKSDVACDHLMLGLYREDFPLLDEVFATFRVDSLAILDRLMKAHPETERPVDRRSVAMGPEALGAICLAEAEADRMSHDVLTPSHTFLGLLAYNRAHLDRYFIRVQIVRKREEAVLNQVRELVSWLRFEPARGTEHNLERLSPGTLVEQESAPLLPTDRDPRTGFSVRMRMLKHFRAR